MTLVIEATPGLATSNSYATLADAEAYALTVPIHDDWTAAVDATKNAAIVQATRMLDTLLWVGWRAYPTVQTLQWPRQGVHERDGLFFLPGTTIPWQIKDATCEFAVRLVADDRAADAGGLSYGKLELGSLKLSDPTRRHVPASVLEMVREFLASAGSGPRMELA